MLAAEVWVGNSWLVVSPKQVGMFSHHGWSPSLVFDGVREGLRCNLERLDHRVNAAHSVIHRTVPCRVFEGADGIAAKKTFIGVV